MRAVKFLDTYAIIELVRGNPQCAAFEDVITTKLNLLETYYVLLKASGEKLAETVYDNLLPACIEPSDDVIKAAMRLRLQQRSEKNLISYIDCVGYCTALAFAVPFVTGEKHFRTLPNVEWIG